MAKKKPLLEIHNLTVNVENRPILKNFSLTVFPGEIHAIMGPNGAGKSTLAKVIAGHPAYEVVKGEIYFKNENLLELEPEERAHRGVFMGFQYPIEIPGVSNIEFLRAAYNAKRKFQQQPEMPLNEFEKLLEAKMASI